MDFNTLLSIDLIEVSALKSQIDIHQDTIDDTSATAEEKSLAMAEKAIAMGKIAKLLQPLTAPTTASAYSSGGATVPTTGGATVPVTPAVGTTAPKIKTPMSVKGSTGSTVIKPKDGGIYKEPNGNLVPFSSFDPDTKANIFSWDADKDEWICDDHDPNMPNHFGHIHPGQLRPTSVKDSLKTEVRCSTLSNPVVYNGLEPSTGEITFINHRSYLQSMRQAVIERGLYGVFLVPDSANQEGWDLFHKHGRFTVVNVQSHTLKLQLIADPYCVNNLKWSGNLLRSTLHPTLKSKVDAVVGVNASGPEVLIAAIKEAFTGDSYEQLEALKKELKDMKLKDFPGEDINAANERIKDIMERLSAADVLLVGDSLLLSIVTIYEQSSAEHFRLWAVGLYAKVNDFVKLCRFSDPSVLKTMPNQITYETLTTDSNAKYLELKGNNRYPPALTSHPNSDAGPVAMIAEITKRATASVLAKLGSGGTQGAGRNNGNQSKPKQDKGDTAKGDGQKSGSSGTQTKSNNFTKLPKDFPQDEKGWVTHLPKNWDPATKVFKLGDKSYKWCTECKRWCFHRADGHAAWKAKQASKKGGGSGGGSGAPAPTSTPQPSQQQATLAALDSDSDSDDDGQGPWIPVRI